MTLASPRDVVHRRRAVMMIYNVPQNRVETPNGKIINLPEGLIKVAEVDEEKAADLVKERLRNTGHRCEELSIWTASTVAA